MTWVFLGGLTVVVAAVGGIALRTARADLPADLDESWQTIEAFYDRRPDRLREIRLGRGWRSTTDRRASVSLTWVRETSELVALRQPERVAVSIEPAGVHPVPAGVKVLAVVDLRALHRLHPHRLRAEPDGLDRLTAALGHPYVPPAGAAAGER